MAEKSVSALLVVSDGKLVRSISERDYARKVVLQRRSSSDTLVHELCPARSSPLLLRIPLRVA